MFDWHKPHLPYLTLPTLIIFSFSQQVLFLIFQRAYEKNTMLTGCEARIRYNQSHSVYSVHIHDTLSIHWLSIFF